MALVDDDGDGDDDGGGDDGDDDGDDGGDDHDRANGLRIFAQDLLMFPRQNNKPSHEAIRKKQKNSKTLPENSLNASPV